jgi:hypothetical protein
MMQLLIDGAEGLKVLQTSWLSTRAREGELEINCHACLTRDTASTGFGNSNMCFPFNFHNQEGSMNGWCRAGVL